MRKNTGLKLAHEKGMHRLLKALGFTADSIRRNTFLYETKEGDIGFYFQSEGVTFPEAPPLRGSASEDFANDMGSILAPEWGNSHFDSLRYKMEC
jgi:hypothetical protein